MGQELVGNQNRIDNAIVEVGGIDTAMNLLNYGNNLTVVIETVGNW
ncbi:MAG: hypothetical protein OXC03_04400 [Flavobacteriaceae bacterium]|nr:hypothetical protein [Flavobacteriaceae bacterium]